MSKDREWNVGHLYSYKGSGHCPILITDDGVINLWDGVAGAVHVSSVSMSSYDIDEWVDLGNISKYLFDKFGEYAYEQSL